MFLYSFCKLTDALCLFNLCGLVYNFLFLAHYNNRMKNAVRKAVVAAAGKGTRMLHLAVNKPKHLIKVRNRPFLYYVLRNLRDAGIAEIILVVGHKKEAMEKFVQEHKNEFSVKLIDQFETAGTEKYGTAIPIWCVKEAVNNEPFLALFGDNIYSPKDIKSLAIGNEYTYISGFKHAHPEKYGVLLTQRGILKDIIEKPTHYISNLIYTGLAKFTPEIFEVIDRVGISPRGEYELTDAIKILAKQGKVKVREIKDYWFDFGNPADVIRVSAFFEQNANNN